MTTRACTKPLFRQVCDTIHGVGWIDMHSQLLKEHGTGSAGEPHSHVHHWLRQSADEQHGNFVGLKIRPLVW